MAFIRRIKSGWQAQIAKRGVRTSRTFPTKREAQDWAARQEHLILEGEGKFGPGTLGDVLRRYAEAESPKKRGARWEVVRLNKISRHPIATKSLKSLSSADFAAWRDERLGEVSPGSVRREMQLLSAVMTVCVDEWGLLPKSPIAGVVKPRPAQPRSRLVTDAEIDKLVAVAGTDLTRIAARAVHAFRFSCLTAMRAGEVCALRPHDVVGAVARLHTSKTGKRRDVPLSSAARALWAELPDGWFNLAPAQIDANFRKVRAAAKIEGLTYHDSRHRALTDLAKLVHVLDLARIAGHDNVSQLLTYYNESAADIATRLG